MVGCNKYLVTSHHLRRNTLMTKSENLRCYKTGRTFVQFYFVFEEEFLFLHLR